MSKTTNMFLNISATFLLIIYSSQLAYAESSVRFLIPGGKGGGWDTTARAVGNTLVSTGLSSVENYEHIGGGGGVRGLLALLKNDQQAPNTLMVQSVPLIIRHLSGHSPKSWRHTQPIAILTSTYQAIAVPQNSPHHTLSDLLNQIRTGPSDVAIAGGSSLFSLDHITLGLIAKAANIELSQVRYSPADGGKDALDRLVAGSVAAVVSGIDELLPAAQAGTIRLLGVTSPETLPTVPAPTLVSQGYNVVFSNWRGFFASPAMPVANVKGYESLLLALTQTSEWTDVMRQNHWEPQFLKGEELSSFLEDQERSLSQLLSELRNNG